MRNNLGRLSLGHLPTALRVSAQRETDMELVARMWAGSFVYPAMLLLLAVTTPYCADHPYLFWSVVWTTAIALAIRIAVSRFRKALYARGRRVCVAPLFVSMALSGGAAGFLLLSVAMKYGFSSWTFAVTMMWMCGIASGSTIGLKLNFPLLLVQFTAVLAPIICYEFLLGSREGASLGFATLVFFGFHVVQGYRLNAMHRDLCSNRALEKLRIQELEAAKSSAEHAQQRLQHQATHDTLTGVLNHAQILNVIDRELEGAIRTAIPFGIVLLDLDNFKEVNDRFGHLGGDEVPRTLAARLRRSIRSHDAVGRYGGEEFLVVLPGCSAEDCAASAERIRHVIQSESVVYEHFQIRMTASFGIAMLDPGTDTDYRPMLARADQALYRAKHKGKNRIEVDSFESKMVPILIARALARS